MPQIKAVVLDLDGTLLNSDKLISPRNFEAVKRCHELGIHMIIATARPPRVASQFIKDLPFADYRVFYNGALVSCGSKRLTRHFGIPSEISQEIIQYLSSNAPDAGVSFEVNDAWYTSKDVPDYQLWNFGLRPSDPHPQVMESQFINSLAPTKILVVGYEYWKDLAATFGEEVNVIATDKGTLVQITHKSASKEIAVRWILDEVEVGPENVMVFGDDCNDLGLFSMCGFPVAMENGIQELKTNAKYVTNSNDHDGVAVALEKFVLQ